MKHIRRFNELRVIDSEYKCKVCGSDLYRTDGGGDKATLQCSSEESKFWNYNRGTSDQKVAHKHFMNSSIVIPSELWNKLEKI